MGDAAERILFVCSGNICRSPMAAGLATRAFADADIDAIIASAGTLGIQGTPASPHAISAMAELGIDIGQHRSQGVSTLILGAVDHVVVMAPIHEEHILVRMPSIRAKLRRMWEYARPSGRLKEIADPIGQNYAAFVACRQELEACVDAFVNAVKTRSC